MRHTMMMVTAALLVLPAAAYAETMTSPANGAAAQPAAAAHPGNLQQQVAQNLRQSGFTDIKVMPDSFIVQAKDQSGNPVSMFITPNSMTEVTAMNSQQGNGNANQGSTFASVGAGDDLSSKVIGLDVYDKANQDVGKIKDIAFDHSGLQAYIVGVGDHEVAIAPMALNLSYNSTNKSWHAAVNATADQLKTAPAYREHSNT